MEEILTAISTVGFPIAACVFLYLKSERDREAHKAETDGLRECLNDLKLVMQRVLDKLSD